MHNPNPYDDDAYVEACQSLQSALYELWASGLSVKEIEGELSCALENALETTQRFKVEIHHA